MTEKRDAKQGKRLGYLLMLGHVCSDINQGALAAVLPFLVLYGGYGYAEVSFLVLAANVVSGVVQPVFGAFSDKHPCPWFAALGVLLAGAGMAGIGIAGSYPLVIASAVFSGIGVALFHPEGGRLANIVASADKASGMSIFAVGGNVGFAVGPLMVAGAVTLFGLAGTLVFLVPTTAWAIAMFSRNRVFASYGGAAKGGVDEGCAPDRWGAFSVAMVLLSLRSIVYYAITAYVPLFIVGVLGQTEAFGSMAISVFAILSAVSTVFSGRLNARFGVKVLTKLSFFLLAVALVLFCLNRSSMGAFALAAFMGIVQSSAYPSVIAEAQGFLPRHLGMASGLTFGVVVCAGGVASPVFGLIGDAQGLPTALAAVAAVAVIAFVVSFAFCALVTDDEASLSRMRKRACRSRAALQEGEQGEQNPLKSLR